ncbi:hypothetical protein [Mycolicibacterium austroafricanum]|uniref:hypothetical protein n=1 Tax=Mycolicibacterium austroafricanum TaxID=39687 RepID=UPI000685C47F|nr:hypothetical protein [Mycolicibacterium austroafricanum]QZY43941.1 hypothetical protein K5L12_16575 [Mycolicibacterium austroafricanum]
MAGGNLMHWIQQLDELEQVVKNFADAMRHHPRQDEWIAGDPSQALRETTPGHYLRDLPRLDTADDLQLRRTSSALAQAIRAATTGRRQRWTARELVPALDAIYAGIAPMRAALTAPAAAPETLEAIVEELRSEFTLSLAVMLSGQYAVVTKLYEWYSAGAGVPADAYLDVSRFQIVKAAGPGRIAMRDLEIATHGGVTMLTPQTGFVSFDRFSPVQQLLYGQWFAYMHSLWDEQFRARVAAAHGTAPDGDPWDARDIRVPLFGDIRRIRNDFIHNKGIVDEASETEVLTWFTEGKAAAIKPEQMLALLTMFPESDLLAVPARAARHSRKPLPWSAEPDLINQVQKRARQLGLNRKTRKEIGPAALELWLAANPAPAAGG